MRRLACLLALLFSASALAAAPCQGTDLRPTLTESERSEIDAAVAGHPYMTGNHWIARRGDTTLHLVGTIHVDDPRLDGVAQRLGPVLESADLLLLEMTLEDQETLQTELMNDPELLLLADTTLPEIMSEDSWQALSSALAQRGMPGFMAAKMRPWYLAMMLSLPSCALDGAQAGKSGLDQRLAEAAEAADVPTAALEDFRTIFRTFNAAPIPEQIEMLEAALYAADEQGDGLATLRAAYFDEQMGESWALSKVIARRHSQQSREEIDRSFDEMEEGLLIARNQDWMPVILEAAEEYDLVVIASGAAHLPGPHGLLTLLEAEGFTLERAPF
ncbi:TraB/GumN family protein [Litorisediminicola beolgyonensis]|uniref:TraB/GumN family protein n=1 Tax=Litorisediminicola beolgyonensis TaxID=1173614 RepID=A0ABW3ZF93_9RHOB